MIKLVWTVWLWLACTGQGSNTFIVEGVVVEIKDAEVVIDHEDIEGLMPAMVMGFRVEEGAMPSNLRPGHRVIARYLQDGPKSRLNKIRITGEAPVPKLVTAPVRPGEVWPGLDVPVATGGTVRLGEGQTERILLTFIYTRCPLPEACPAIVARYQAVQERIADAEGVQLLAITLDPEHDTLPVLKTYAEDVGAGPKWALGRVEPDVLAELAKRAGMNVMQKPDDADQILHSLRILVIDRGGALIERYDDPRFDRDRVVAQLTTGTTPLEP